MTSNEKLAKLQKEAPEEISKFCEAAKLAKMFDGFSISVDNQTLEKIKKILSFTPATAEGKELKKNLLATAKIKSQKGMFGDGIFLID